MVVRHRPTELRERSVADASTAIFTVDAGGIKKTVSVYALGMEIDGMADGPARAAFQKLAEHLSDFDQGGSISTNVYSPDRYRGILTDGSAAPDQKAWPWGRRQGLRLHLPRLTRARFRLLPAVHVRSAGPSCRPRHIEGGAQGAVLRAPDTSKVYSLSLRPVASDEQDSVHQRLSDSALRAQPTGG